MSSIESTGSAAELLTQTARRLLAIGRADIARQVARLALKTDPAHGDAHAVMASILDATGASGRALRHWREAARLRPNEPRQQFNLALALLGAGDWECGLPLYESRLEDADWTSMAARPSLGILRERRARPDTDLNGRHVMVVTEQGLGDSIWAVRFLEPLAGRCGTLTIATSAALKPLLARVCGPAQIIAPPVSHSEARINLSAPEATCDYIIPMMSLPWLLGIRPGDAAKSRMPYLSPDSAQVAAWREKYRRALPDARRIIGLIWRVSPTSPAAGSRSIPASALAALATLTDIGFVNLQGGDRVARKEIETVLPGVLDGFANRPEPPPLDEFAAAIAATDLLLSVDTMGAHLAGAMRHPGLVLLPSAPAFSGLFWGNGGERSAWYPSLHLIGRSGHLDWNNAIAAAVAALYTT